jgi:uncharacterized protein (TIGR02611 family)
LNWPAGTIKKVVVGVIGGTVVLVGIAMIVLPGPAFVLIPLGLAILATEFAWAKKLLKKVKLEIKKRINRGGIWNGTKKR